MRLCKVPLWLKDRTVCQIDWTALSLSLLFSDTVPFLSFPAKLFLPIVRAASASHKPTPLHRFSLLNSVDVREKKPCVLTVILSVALALRWRQVPWGRARPPDVAGERRSQSPQCQQLLLHDPVVQRPHPPADQREDSAWERDGGGQREVQDLAGRNRGSV